MPALPPAASLPIILKPSPKSLYSPEKPIARPEPRLTGAPGNPAARDDASDFAHKLTEKQHSAARDAQERPHRPSDASTQAPPKRSADVPADDGAAGDRIDGAEPDETAAPHDSATIDADDAPSASEQADPAGERAQDQDGDPAADADAAAPRPVKQKPEPSATPPRQPQTATTAEANDTIDTPDESAIPARDSSARPSPSGTQAVRLKQESAGTVRPQLSGATPTALASRSTSIGADDPTTPVSGGGAIHDGARPDRVDSAPVESAEESAPEFRPLAGLPRISAETRTSTAEAARSTSVPQSSQPQKNEGSIFALERAPAQSPGSGASNTANQAPGIAPTKHGSTASAAPPAQQSSNRSPSGGGRSGGAGGGGDGPASAVVRGLSASVLQRGGSMNIKLIPETLGEVRIVMQLDQGSVAVRIDATTEAAHRLLSDQLSLLRSSLESKGLNVERINVHLAPQQGATLSAAASTLAGGGQQTTSGDHQPWNGDPRGGGVGQDADAAGSESRGRGERDPRDESAGDGSAEDATDLEHRRAQRREGFDGLFRLSLSAVG